MGAVGWVQDADSGRHGVSAFHGARGARRGVIVGHRRTCGTGTCSPVWIRSALGHCNHWHPEVGGCDLNRVSTVDQVHVSASERDKDVFGSESA